jgi:D-alanyl-D-alanine carboxypeptidase/D-alanyl-D-alanine-endopeptidase (penicillin-binding protein 4)
MQNLKLRVMRIFKVFIVLHFTFFILTSCSTQRQIAKEAKADFFSDDDFGPAQIGISIFDPATNKYLYNYQGDKYFIPASNTKLFSCYAAMKYLGDSIVAAKYIIEDDAVVIQATGDPTFLHPDFKDQRLYNFLKQDWIKKVEVITPFASQPLGRGWAWDDFKEGYMAERDPFPIYGNVATVTLQGDSFKTVPPSVKEIIGGLPGGNGRWDITRNLGGHFFTVANGTGSAGKIKIITMAMERGSFAARFLSDTLHKTVVTGTTTLPAGEALELHSQPTDSLLKMTMHRSDNFFAEQTLLMVSNKILGEMNDYRVTDTLLNTDYKDLPQKPKWVDGSGLSRYNLFTPQDFVWLLNKMKNEFSFSRIKEILPTGGEGTLSSLYKNYNGRIYAKTGTLSNHVALSGFLLTKNNRTLIFSILVNNQQVSATNIRKAIEKFVTSVIEKY